MAPLLSVIKIVKFCGVMGGGGGALGGAKILQKVMPAPSVMKIVKYCGVRGKGGRQNPTKIIASLISVIKIVQYFRIVGGGGGIGGR